MHFTEFFFFGKKPMRKFYFFPHCAYLFPVIYREQIATHFRILCLGPSFSPTPSELGGWFFTPRTPFYGRRRVDPHISTWGGHRGYLLGSRVRGVNHMMVWSWSRRRTEITKKKKNFQFFLAKKSWKKKNTFYCCQNGMNWLTQPRFHDVDGIGDPQE